MPGTIRFTATEVALDPQVGFVGFAGEEGRRYFWMQPGEMTTEKDEIWLERDDQNWGRCGGKWNIILSRNNLIVDTRDLPWMECESIEIDFEVDDETYTRLKRLLEQIMIGCPYDLQIRADHPGENSL